MIEFDDVSKVYTGGAKTKALEHVDLTIEDGEFVYIIGESGAGKSTLLKLLMGEERPTSGSIFVDDWNVGKIWKSRLPRYRQNFGVIFQDFRLIPDASVYENIALAQRIAHVRFGSMRKRIRKYLGQLGLEEKIHAKPPQLSGGEQQRVAIARAIINGPRYLLCDEPTGNLDPNSSASILKELESINRSGTTVIVVTHDAALVNAMPHRVVRIEDGRIVRDEEKGGYENA